MQKLKERWRKLPALPAVREITIVVVGILIAFSLDAGWEGRTAAARERAHLHALNGDFEQNMQRLEHLVAMEERVARSSRALLLIAARREAVPADSITHLLGAVFTSQRFEPVMGSYRALESSGGPALLRDDSLRAALAGFAAQLDVRQYERFSDQLFLVFLREFAGELSFFAPYVAGADAPMLRHDPVELLGSPKFQEYLALRHIAANDVAFEYRQLHQRSGTILTRLRQLSGRRGEQAPQARH